MGETIRRIICVFKQHPMKVRILLVAVLFAVLFSNIHPSAIVRTIGAANTRFLLYALCLLPFNIGLQVVKWRYILRNLTPRPKLRMILVSVFGGFFLGAATPGRTGEIGRGFLMPGYSKVKIASLTVVDKGFNQLMIYLGGLTSLALVLPWPFSLIPLAAIIGVLAIVFNIHRFRPRIERMLHRITHREMADNALAAFDALSVSTVAGMLAYSVVFYATFTCQFFLTLRAYTPVSFLTGIRSVPLIFFANSIVPISIGEFGVKDFAAVQILGRNMIPGAAALSATFTQNLLTFIIPSLIGGIVFMFTKHPSLKAISTAERKIAEEENNTPAS